MAELGPRLAALQERLYAEGKSGGTRRVVLVLQAMGTGGKDGAVKHVIGLVNPAGVRITSFGLPTHLLRRAAGPPAGPARRPDEALEVSPGDADERRAWLAYQQAYGAVLERCSTDAAPWYPQWPARPDLDLAGLRAALLDT